MRQLQGATLVLGYAHVELHGHFPAFRRRERRARGCRRVYEFNDQLSLCGQWGWFYTTTLSSDREFGLKNLPPSQANPVLTYRINARSQASVYLKFARLFGLSFSERELALGGGWSSRTLKGLNYGFGFDFSDIQIQLDGGTLRSTNTVLGGSISF